MQRIIRTFFDFIFLASPAFGQTLDWTNFDAQRDAILPRPDEERWLAIRWYPTLWHAVRVAHEEEKPVLLWAMNGHPLGCT